MSRVVLLTVSPVVREGLGPRLVARGVDVLVSDLPRGEQLTEEHCPCGITTLADVVVLDGGGARFSQALEAHVREHGVPVVVVPPGRRVEHLPLLQPADRVDVGDVLGALGLLQFA